MDVLEWYKAGVGGNWVVLVWKVGGLGVMGWLGLVDGWFG